MSSSNRRRSAHINQPQSSLSRHASSSSHPVSSLSNRSQSSLSNNAHSSTSSYQTAVSHMSDPSDRPRQGSGSSGENKIDEENEERHVKEAYEDPDWGIIEEGFGRQPIGKHEGKDDDEDRSSQEDSFDWTSSESGSPREQQQRRPSSPRHWPLREVPPASSETQLVFRTPVMPQVPLIPQAGSSRPPVHLSDEQAFALSGLETAIQRSFVPNDAVFPTVVATPETGFANPRGNFLAKSFTMHVDGPIVRHEEPRLHHWFSLPLSRVLGMELWFSPWAVYKNLYEYNYLIRILSIDPNFERLRREWAYIKDGWIQPASFKGGAMLVLENGKVLKEKHVEALVTYIDAFLPEVVQFFRGGVRTLKQLDEVSEASKEKLTPLAFAEFWFKFSKRKADVTGDKAWLRVECPVDERFWKDSIDLTRVAPK